MKPGDTIVLEDGQALVLGKLIKSGGAGSVYLLPGSPAQVAKLYHPHLDREANRKKLAAMLNLSPELPDQLENGKRYVQIAWPQAAVRDRQGNFLGFVMPLLDMAHTAELEQLLQERQARAAGLPTGLGAKMTLAANLAGVLAALHQQHHYVVDLKPVNLRFYRDSLYIAMLDCDGFSIQGRDERYRAEQFTTDYLAPECQGKGMPAGAEAAQDRFALAVVIFQLLNFGIHPYGGRAVSALVPTEIAARIRDGYYPHGIKPHRDIVPNVTSGHALMPPELRTLFDRAFAGPPHERPSAAEWMRLLRRYALRNADLSANALVVCRAYPEHQHFAGLGCATCARVEAIAAAAADASAARQQLQALAQAQLPPISATHYLYTGAPLTRRASLGTPARPPRWSLAISGRSWTLIVVLVALLLFGFSLYTSSRNQAAQQVAAPAQAQPDSSVRLLAWQRRASTGTEPSSVRIAIRALEQAMANKRNDEVLLGLQMLYRMQPDDKSKATAMERLRRSMMETAILPSAMDERLADAYRDQLIADPRDHMVASVLGRMHLAANEPLAARQYFEQAIWARPADGVAWLGLAAISVRRKQGLPSLRQAVLGLVVAQSQADAAGKEEAGKRMERAASILGLGMAPDRLAEWQATLAYAGEVARGVLETVPPPERAAAVELDSLQPLSYDENAATGKLSGENTLTIAFDAAGVPQSITGSQPAHQRLNEAWLEAARQWRYLPAVRRGDLQPSSVQVVVRYAGGKMAFRPASPQVTTIGVGENR